MDHLVDYVLKDEIPEEKKTHSSAKEQRLTLSGTEF